MSFVDRANKHIDQSKRELENRKKLEQDQQREVEKAQVDAQAAQQEQQVKQQEQQVDQQKQEQQEQKQIQLTQQKKTLNLAHAANTPSFKPYTIKSAGKYPWLTNLIANGGRGAKAVAANPAARGAANSAFWDFGFYGYNDPGSYLQGLKEDLTPGEDANFLRPTAGLVNFITGAGSAYGSNKIRANAVTNRTSLDALRAKSLSAKRGPTKANLSEMERLSKSIKSAPALSKLVGSAGFAAGFAERPIISAGMGAVKAQAEREIQDSIQTKLMQLELQKAEDAALQSASDALSNNTPAPTSVPWKTLLALGAVGTGAYAYDKLFKDTPEQSDTVASARNPDRLSLEIPSAKISDGFYNRLGREILFKDKEEEEREKGASVKEAETNLTSQEAYDSLDYPDYLKWRSAQRSNPRPWMSGVESIAPFLASQLGYSLGTPIQRLTQHISKVDTPANNQTVGQGWSKTLDIVRNGNAKSIWSPGHQLNLQTAHA